MINRKKTNTPAYCNCDVFSWFAAILLFIVTPAPQSYGGTDEYGNPSNFIGPKYFDMYYGPKQNNTITAVEGDSLKLDPYAGIDVSFAGWSGSRYYSYWKNCDYILNYSFFKNDLLVGSCSKYNYVPFSIPNLKVEDAGAYRCQISATLPAGAGENGCAAFKKVGISTGMWTVKVEKRQVLVSPKSYTADQKAQVIFKADAGKLVNPQYQWKKDGVMIPGATGNQLLISSAKSIDAGYYSVTVSSAVGSWSSTPSPLTVNPPKVYPPFINQQPGSPTVEVGEKASMAVSVVDETLINYQWMRNSVKIEGATQKTFTVQGARLTDQGTYCVTVSNPAGSVTSANAVLKVGTLPSVSIALPKPGEVYFDFTVLKAKGFSVFPVSLKPIDYSSKPRSYDAAGCVIGNGAGYFVIALKPNISSKTPHTVSWSRDGKPMLNTERKNGYFISSGEEYLRPNGFRGNPIAPSGLYSTGHPWLGAYYERDHNLPTYSFGGSTPGLMDVVFSDDIGSYYDCKVTNAAGSTTIRVTISGKK